MKDNDRGAAAIELAFTLPLLLLVIAGLIEFGIVFNANLTVTHAAHEAARLSALSDWTNPATDDAVKQRAKDTSTTVALSDSDIDTAGGCGKVNVSHVIDTPLFIIIGVNDITVHGQGVEKCYE